MNGAQLVTLLGEENGQTSLDDIFVGGMDERSMVPVSVYVPAKVGPLAGPVEWVKQNPVLAAALAVAAIYLIVQVSKKRRR